MKRFPYAAGYYPMMHAKDEWVRDLDQMQSCGIRLIRTAELFNTWDQLEPLKGVFRFEVLDDFFEVCRKRQMKILLGTGTASPPYWLHEMDPEMNITGHTGRQYPNNVSYSWACFHNPVYLEACENYIRVLIEHYKDHQALFAYQIHNEIGFPFMPLNDGEIDMYCYCDHTKAEFRKWLKYKYKSLANLNHAWTWSATNTYHYSWDMVEPPYAKPTSWSSITRFLDFRLFMMDSITHFVSWQNQLIKEMDQQHPTSTNIFFMKGEDKMGVMTAIDQFEIAKTVDVIGYDLYPGSGNKLEARPEFTAMFLDHARSVSRPLNKPYWLMEMESGPINGWALGPHRNTSCHDIRRYVLEAISYDAKMILFQGYRQWDFQPLCWGGLVDLDGEPIKRTSAAADMGRFIRANEDFLLEAKSSKSEVAILISKENAIIANGMGHEAFLVSSLRGAYRVFWEMGFTIDYITTEHLQNDYAMDYKVMIAPFYLTISGRDAKHLLKYTQNGGLLIGFPRLGYVDDKGWYNHRWPPYELGEVFGVKSESVEADVKSLITYQSKNYEGFWHKEYLEAVSKDLKVLAYFFDDTPAVALNPCGRGCGLYFATHSEQAFLEQKDYLLWDVLQNILPQRGVLPKVNISYSNRLDHEINGRILEGWQKDMLIITVYLKAGREDFFINNHKLIRVSLIYDTKIHKIESVCSDKQIDFVQNGKHVTFDYDLKKNEYPVWYLYKQ